MKVFGENSDTNIRILLIEDDPDDTLFFRHCIPDSICLIVTDNGAEGISLIKEYRPHVCFLDLRLPGMSGEDVCKEIRTSEDKTISEIPIVMLSGKKTEADQIVGRVIGANYYLTKPYDAKQINEQIEKYTKIPESDLKSNTILLIDDDPDDTHLCMTLLHRDKKQSYQILTADTLIKGFQMVKEHHPQAVICDLSLPDSSAENTCHELKKIAQKTPCIILTESKDDLLAEQAVRNGVQDYILKEDLDSKTISRALRYSIERFALINQVVRMSINDELTECLNRRGFLSLADQQLQLLKRKDVPVQIIFIDIDKFKPINDQHGHKTGDEVLREVVHLLKKTLRKTDLIGRIGGDEFVLMIWNEDPCSRLDAITIRIQKEIDKFNKIRKFPFDVEVSMGAVVERSDKINSLDEIIQIADQRLYDSKIQKSGPV